MPADHVLAGQYRAGSESDLLSTHYDLLATLADIGGVETPEGKDSVSYLPTLLGQLQQQMHDYAEIHNHRTYMGSSTVITCDEWKLIEVGNNAIGSSCTTFGRTTKSVKNFGTVSRKGRAVGFDSEKRNWLRASRPEGEQMMRNCHTRYSIQFAIAFVLLLTSGGWAAERRPNVIVTDDRGYGDLSCHGNPVLKTPEMERLNRESVRLTDFHADPTCEPTRAAFMAGRYSARTGVWLTYGIDEDLGKLRSTLSELSLERDTILVFFNDNGTNGGASLSRLGSGTRNGREIAGYNAGMRGRKTSRYECGHRAACFVHWPGGGLSGGRDVDGVTAHIDLLPNGVEGWTFIDVEMPGKYRIGLRRYPREPNLGIRAKNLPWPSASDTQARMKGVRMALDIVEVGLILDGLNESRQVFSTDDEISFDVEPCGGQHRIQTWFTQRDGKIDAAHYTDIEPAASPGQSGETIYQVPEGLVRGGAFIDNFLSVPVKQDLEVDVWGAENVIPRDADNGIEDAEYSYWGGNIIQGDDGKNHLFVCRWREDESKGHHIWWKSDVVHAVSDDPIGPYQVIQEIGPGHNPEIYRLNDGTFIIGVMGYSAYRADSMNGPWTKIETVLKSPQEKFNKSNRTYVVRDNGSVLMMNKNGYVSICDSGVEQFHQVTDQSVYPKIENHFEDPVIWKDEVQYHLVVNDWYTRKAFYLRSPDGIDWKWDPGFAYDTSIMQHQGGTSEAWYKFERPKVRLDEHGRATHMNFAVIDVPKDDDRGSDNHSSKNVVIPLVVGRRIVILNEQPITADTQKIDVKILAEPGFNPLTEIEAGTLRFGASEEVNFGRGSRMLKTEAAGNDLIVTFGGKGNGLAEGNFAAKLLGRTTDDDLLFGYAKLPGIALNRTNQDASVSEFGEIPDLYTGVWSGTWTVEGQNHEVHAHVVRYKNSYEVTLRPKPDSRLAPLATFRFQAETLEPVEQDNALRLKFFSGNMSGTISRSSFRLRRVPLEPSPTLGKAAPKNAMVLFDGSNLKAWESIVDGREIGWKMVEGNAVEAFGRILGKEHKQDIRTKAEFGDYELHVEFMLPYLPKKQRQGRSNSDVFHFGRYETQILDSFGLYGKSREAGGIYKIREPDANAVFPPGLWQTYDVTAKAPRFDAQGAKTENARLTVRLNGVLIHDEVEILKPNTRYAHGGERPTGPIILQDHGSAVRFRNIWIRSLSK